MPGRLDLRSTLVGAALTGILAVSIGAATDRPSGSEVLPLRFRVVEAQQPHVTWRHGGAVRLLKLSPWHGKISKDSLDWRRKHETQDLSLAVILTEGGYEIEQGDILGFRLSQHLKAEH